MSDHRGSDEVSWHGETEYRRRRDWFGFVPQSQYGHTRFSE